MPVKAVWVSEANRTFAQNLEDFDRRGARQKIILLLSRVDTIVENLLDFPFSYPKVRGRYRRALAIPEISMFYHVEGDVIYIDFFWYNRRNPDDLPLPG